METANSKTDQTYTFKTNINCSGCVANVTPALNAAEGICHWKVDTENKDKILTVHSDGISEHDIIKAVQSAGYKIEPLPVQQAG